jgi:general secretion pathway protein G
MRLRARDQGFTLIELMVVMALIVILAGISVGLYTNSVTRAKEAVLKTNLFRIRDSIDQYYADKTKYPADLPTLVSEKYMRALPQDPFTNSTETWQTVMSDPQPGSPSAEIGVFDVKSGSEGTALDGSRYADW